MGKSALREVVSMVVQLNRSDDVATVGCKCNGNPQDRPVALRVLCKAVEQHLAINERPEGHLTAQHPLDCMP
jgi:hypothetical protein